MNFGIAGIRLFEHYKAIKESLEYIVECAGIEEFKGDFWVDLAFLAGYQRSNYLLGAHQCSEYFNLTFEQMIDVKTKLNQIDDFHHFNKHHTALHSLNNEHGMLFNARQNKILATFYMCVFFNHMEIRAFKRRDFIYDDEYFLELLNLINYAIYRRKRKLKEEIGMIKNPSELGDLMGMVADKKGYKATFSYTKNNKIIAVDFSKKKGV